MRFHWEKLGLTFSPKEYSAGAWMNSHAQAPASLLLDDRLRVYFATRPEPENGQFVSYTGFVDLDRADPTNILAVGDKPVLELGDKGTFDEFGVYPLSAIQYGDRIRAYYGGWTRCASVPFNVAIGCAESFDDGKTFRRIGPGPVVSYTPDEPFVISGPKIRRFSDMWHLYYIAGKRWVPAPNGPEPVYRIRMATSMDGLNWTREGRDLIEVQLEVDEAQASPDVFFMNGRYHMFFCYRRSLDYRGAAGGYRIGYAHSDDARNWTRDDQVAGIDVSPKGWDSEMVAYPHVFHVGGVTYMAYLGNGVGREGFGLARLTRIEGV